MKEIFHKGELDVQKKTGEELIANSVGRIITDTIPPGAFSFIEEQSMAIISSTDLVGNVWVSPLFGNAGFTSVLNQNSVSFNKKNIYSSKTDIFYKNIEKVNEVGTLFIELSTRRRFRINGKAKVNNNAIELTIQEAYSNCPKYIQQRIVSVPKDLQSQKTITEEEIKLNLLTKDWISKADTFFIGSKSNSNKLDASHRGGNSGFVEILDESTLKIPDYKGNSLYNTLGNIHQNSKAGILFIDFEKGSILQLTGKSAVLFDQNSKEDMLKTGGTGRYLLFTVEQWIKTENHHNVDWEFLSYSPFNP